MKKYNIQFNIGASKYAVNTHDGISRYKDGSEFFDIAIFRNRKHMNEYVKRLISHGYIYS